MRGITIATWRQWGYDKNGDNIITCEDVVLISEQDAKDIYYKRFWLANNIDKIKTQKIAEIICDWIINSGAGIAVPRVQKIVSQVTGKQIAISGKIDNETLKAINTANQSKLYAEIWKAREQFYRDITAANPNFDIFIDGWLRRINDFPKELPNTTFYISIGLIIFILLVFIFRKQILEALAKKKIISKQASQVTPIQILNVKI
jgi:lysozyme family protein